MPSSLGVELRAAPTICFYLDMEFLFSCRSQLPHTSACWLWTRVSLFCKLYVAVLAPLVFEVYRPPPLESQYMNIPELVGTEILPFMVCMKSPNPPCKPLGRTEPLFQKDRNHTSVFKILFIKWKEEYTASHVKWPVYDLQMVVWKEFPANWGVCRSSA